MVIKEGKKILILTGRFGEGHMQAAKAIEEAAKLEYSSLQTVVVDFMEWAHPSLFPVTHYVYMKGIKTFPQLYGYLYQKTYQSNPFSKKLNAVFSLGMRKMLQLLAAEEPAVVVSTYPFASSVLSKLKENNLTNIPLVTVITDHTHHSYWLYPHTDHYIVGSRETKEKLLRLGIPATKISSTGIPIRRRFLQEKDRDLLLEKYNLVKTKPTIAIMGGGEGLIGKGLLDRETLDQFPEELQILILCGHNQKLRERLGAVLADSKHQIQLLGYIEQIDEIMTISDIMITKPGGVTTSEAVAMRLPMLLYKPLPGQEQDNAGYLTSAGVALEVSSLSSLSHVLEELLSNPVKADKMKQNCRRIENQNSSSLALEVIAQYLNHRPFVAVESYRQRKFKPSRVIEKLPLHG